MGVPSWTAVALAASVECPVSGNLLPNPLILCVHPQLGWSSLFAYVT